ncbi:unnamed protein product [Didymodactylos carnosus]|uniref:Uncharacterized protein n=1 Tax=Didymodactylos carnosus TaxID=1234261 RepID=A0A813TPK2_9BILA|nr:unnamed protein product [Didymodactylos carnosus]CAF1504753.1 unnamed protein product [Didymodactylos carnosus]CAF3600681.1 unnamed protein product [Didymodactylos carnosus]CAF4293084.1 unnamed protein product [Didymodactylos carnosus]
MSSSSGESGDRPQRKSSFGITIHHDGQNDQNSLIPSVSHLGPGGPGYTSTADDVKNKRLADDGQQHVSGKISEDDIKNRKP